MLAVAVARGAGEAQDDDIGTVAADDPDDIGEDFFASPLGEGFLGGLGVAEVDGAGEELLGSINAAGGEKFLGAEESHVVALLGADEVLAAFTAGEGEVGSAEVAAFGEVGEDCGVLVVRVSGDHEDIADGVQLAEVPFDLGGTGGLSIDRGTAGIEKEGKEKERPKSHIFFVNQMAGAPSFMLVDVS